MKVWSVCAEVITTLKEEPSHLPPDGIIIPIEVLDIVDL